MENVNRPRLRIESGTEALAQAAAEEFAAAVESALADQERCAVALTGGSTPRVFYRRLAEEPFRGRLPWDRLHFFWGDERHVPPDHADSNFRMAHEALLAHVPVPPENIHRIPAEDPDAARAAAAYEQTLREYFALSDGAFPRFDILLLGLGPDAHIASLFPGNPALRERQRWVAAPWAEHLKTFRITLTVPVLNRAARTFFLVSGAEKAEAVYKVLEGERDPERIPGQVLQPEKGSVLWLLDAAAAGRLPRREQEVRPQT
jgi:6-phosphogluconolactonase